MKLQTRFSCSLAIAAAVAAAATAAPAHAAAPCDAPANEIVEKILFQHSIFKHDRFLLQMSVGTLPHKDVMRAIELLGTEVAPKVREALRPQAANR